MIACLRCAAALVNLGLVGGLPWLLGVPLPGAVAIAASFFAVSWWGCGRVPHGAPAEPATAAEAARVARLLTAPAPRFVLAVDGIAAAAVRAGRGYGLIAGRRIRADHLAAVFAHEIAHHVHGDLLWEPFTDGPARLLLEWGRRVPPFGVVAFPFLVCGAPLARATELRADRTAAAVIPSYPVILQEFASFVPERASLLYPSLRTRARQSARDV